MCCLTHSDTDECASSSANNCSSNAICTNNIGSYTCSCKNGFSGDGFTCNDLDECKLGTHNCSVNADCTNDIGSFTCTCKPGFLGSGTSCDGKYGKLKILPLTRGSPLHVL